MNQVDKDGSGTIEKDEFMALMAEQIEERDQEKELAKVFRIYDDDDNLFITAENIMSCAKDLREEVTEEEVKMMIKMADRKDQGGVDQDDFLHLMREMGLI